MLHTLLAHTFIVAKSTNYTQWLKITENVSFYIASEASYVYILNGLKFAKIPKMVDFGDILSDF